VRTHVQFSFGSSSCVFLQNAEHLNAAILFQLVPLIDASVNFAKSLLTKAKGVGHGPQLAEIRKRLGIRTLACGCGSNDAKGDEYFDLGVHDRDSALMRLSDTKEWSDS